MGRLFSLTLLPIGGTVLNTPPSSTILMKANELGHIRTNDVGGSNWNNNDVIGEVRKSTGYKKWSTNNLSGDRWQNLFVIDDGVAKDLVGVYGGKIYRVDKDRAIVEIQTSDGEVFGTRSWVPIIQYGPYAIFGGHGTTPRKWKHGDTEASKLIQDGTEYEFRFMEQFNNCIIGAYSDEENGMISVRWTDPLPNLKTLSFPAANQVFKPDYDVGITAIKRFGNQSCLVYGRNSIHSLDFYPYDTPIFGLNPQVSGVGVESQASIVDIGDSHLFFDRRHGFVRYKGGRNYQVISRAIESLFDDIDQSQYDKIYGAHIPFSNEVVWTLPLNKANIGTALLYYNLDTGEWRREDRSASAIIYDQLYESYTWEDLVADVGDTWPTTEGLKWSDFLTYYSCIIFGNDDGYLYYYNGDDADGSNFSAYRIEPMLAEPNTEMYKRIQQIWIYGREKQDVNIDIYWRGGDSEHECQAASWTLLGSISQNTTTEAVLYCDQVARWHQFKWGTDLKDERFIVDRIAIKGMLC